MNAVMRSPFTVMVGCVIIILIIASLAILPKMNLQIEGSICLGEMCRKTNGPGGLR